MKYAIDIWTKVRSKADGQEMTVTSCTRRTDGTEYFTCKWTIDHALHSQDFSAEELEVIS